jgi:hypothetical protein
MKLDELRRHLRSKLESEAQSTKDSLDNEAELARACINCGTKLDADEPETHALCRECVIKRYSLAKKPKAKTVLLSRGAVRLSTCAECGCDYAPASATSLCPLCSL